LLLDQAMDLMEEQPHDAFQSIRQKFDPGSGISEVGDLKLPRSQPPAGTIVGTPHDFSKNQGKPLLGNQIDQGVIRTEMETPKVKRKHESRPGI
jgi:hypothetical protein